MSQKDDEPNLSRRNVLKGTAAAGALAGMSGTAAGDLQALLDQANVQTALQQSAPNVARQFNLLGIVSGWIGIGPAEIGAETNPALRVVEGRDYEVFWVNGDGNHHNFNILDENGNVLQSTDTLNENGATARLTFTAEPQMASYKCLPHPVQMWGRIEFVDPRDVHALRVRVEDGSGEPIPAYVSVGEQLYDIFAATVGFSTVLARGQAGEKSSVVRFDTLENGDYTVTAWAYNHEEVTQDVTIDGSDKEITLTLPKITPGDPTQVYELSLEEGGWKGQSPDSIAGQTNPTLSVTPGETYQVNWTNNVKPSKDDSGSLRSEELPGHNFVVAEQSNNTILRSNFLHEAGQTQSVKFVATENLGRYMDQAQLNAIGEFSVENGGSGGG